MPRMSKKDQSKIKCPVQGCEHSLELTPSTNGERLVAYCQCTRMPGRAVYETDNQKEGDEWLQQAESN